MKNFSLIEKILLVCGLLFGSYCGYSLFASIQASNPLMINGILMVVFGGFLGAGAFYTISWGFYLIFKLTIHCKQLLEVPSEK